MNQVFDETNTGRMNPDMIRDINTRLFFRSGGVKPVRELRSWQYVEMEYRRIQVTPPSYVPPLESMEDAEIWMCLDERVNSRLRMRESSLAG